MIEGAPWLLIYCFASWFVVLLFWVILLFFLRLESLILLSRVFNFSIFEKFVENLSFMNPCTLTTYRIILLSDTIIENIIYWNISSHSWGWEFQGLNMCLLVNLILPLEGKDSFGIFSSFYKNKFHIKHTCHLPHKQIFSWKWALERFSLQSRETSFFHSFRLRLFFIISPVFSVSSSPSLECNLNPQYLKNP